MPTKAELEAQVEELTQEVATLTNSQPLSPQFRVIAMIGPNEWNAYVMGIAATIDGLTMVKKDLEQEAGDTAPVNWLRSDEGSEPGEHMEAAEVADLVVHAMFQEVQVRRAVSSGITPSEVMAAEAALHGRVDDLRPEY